MRIPPPEQLRGVMWMQHKAAVQPKTDMTLATTDCGDRNSGDSMCGHEYGTRLPPDEKRELLEYLKLL